MGNTSSAATNGISPLVIKAERGRRALSALRANNETLGAAAKLARKGSEQLVRTLSDRRLKELDNRTGGGKRKKIKSKKRTKRKNRKLKEERITLKRIIIKRIALEKDVNIPLLKPYLE